MPRLVPLIACLLMMGLTACTSSVFKADITRFHAEGLGSAFDGQTARIEPMGLLPNDLAFKLLSQAVQDGIAPLGIRPAGEQTADLIIKAHFMSEVVKSERDPAMSNIGIGVGGGSRGSSVGMGVGFHIPAAPVTIIHRQLAITIEKAESGERLFEGRANAEGQGKDSEKVLPLMIKTLLKNFPGTNGETLTMTLSNKD